MDTGVTSALILGSTFCLYQFTTQQPPALTALVDQLNAYRSQWAHPLLLPCILLATHAQMIPTYMVDNLSLEVVRVEHSVGVTRAGRTQRTILEFRGPQAAQEASGRSLFTGEHLNREHAKKSIEDINDLSTIVIFAARSPQWRIESTKFLLNFLDRDEILRHYIGISSLGFREALDYTRYYCKVCLEVAQSSEARMKLQLNTLYTSIAQDDGQMSARLAASAGKDSISMKIIALITASYLPGTFVATLFSMGMFRWQQITTRDENSQPTTTISPDFWIYWAVAVPFTILTITGWATWWRIEKMRFEKDVQKAVRDKPAATSFVREVKLPWGKDSVA